MIETMEVTLTSGGVVCLQVDVDWLSAPIEDLKFVRDLVVQVRSYEQAEPAPVAPPPLPRTPPEPKVKRPDPVATIAKAEKKAAAKKAPPAKKSKSAPAVDADFDPERYSPAPARKGPGPVAVGRPPLQEIAAVCREAQAAGASMGAALATKFGKPESTTRNWITLVRNASLLGPAPKPNLHVVEDNTRSNDPTPPFNALRVAETYRAALRTNRRPVQAIADQFAVSRDVAQEWVAQCRERGALPPADQPQLSEDERRALLDTVKPESVS